MKQSYTSLDSYILTKTLGSGSTSKIKLGVHIETGQQVVVKVYRQRAGASAVNEVSYFARKIRHRNLLKAYEYNLKGVLIKRGSSKARYRAY
jgi:serine/threonine protein kinase